MKLTNLQSVLHSTQAQELQMIIVSSVNRFLSRVSTLTRDIDIAILSVCLSVRNVPVLDENGLTYRYSFFTIR